MPIPQSLENQRQTPRHIKEEVKICNDKESFRTVAVMYRCRRNNIQEKENVSKDKVSNKTIQLYDDSINFLTTIYEAILFIDWPEVDAILFIDWPEVDLVITNN